MMMRVRWWGNKRKAESDVARNNFPLKKKAVHGGKISARKLNKHHQDPVTPEDPVSQYIGKNDLIALCYYIGNDVC